MDLYSEVDFRRNSKLAKYPIEKIGAENLLFFAPNPQFKPVLPEISKRMNTRSSGTLMVGKCDF